MEPEFTAQQAHSYAMQYFHYAQTLPEGAAKNEAIRASQGWSAEAHRIYQLTQAHQYAYPAPAPPPKKSNTLVVVLAIVLPITLILMLIGGVVVLRSWSNVVRDGAGSGPSALTANQPSDLPDEMPVAEPGTVEGDWRSGASTYDVPSDVDMGAPSRFSTEFFDAEDFVNRGPVSGVTIVYTNDPEYNCAWKDDYDYAGCYYSDYTETIFLWWNRNASEDGREFIAAHELSHYLQWHYKFDLMYSAFQDSTLDYDVWYKIVETDATCRVLSWGGYNEEIARYSSSPCDTDDWSDTWLEDQAAKLGLIVTDW